MFRSKHLVRMRLLVEKNIERLEGLIECERLLNNANCEVFDFALKENKELLSTINATWDSSARKDE